MLLVLCIARTRKRMGCNGMGSSLSLSLSLFFSFSNFDPANTLLNDPIIRDTPRDTKSGATV